ncbi:MAG: ferritin family protein [Phycisphaerae bacterium]
MSISFNADEVFEMAEEIERQAVKFYSEAAQKATSDDMKRFFIQMSGMEAKHVKIFADMREHLTDEERAETTYDPDNEAAQYLQTMADAKGWEGRVTPTQKFTGKESMKEVIEIALNAEKESVVFYYGIKSLVPEKAGRDKLEQIIMEELSHIRILLEYLKEVI